MSSSCYGLIVLMIINAGFFSLPAMTNEVEGKSKSVVVIDTARRERLVELAYILAGKDISRKYFKELDLTKVKRIGFVSSSIASDLRYVDTIFDPSRFQVERKNYDFSGHLSNTEIVTLSEAEFFLRIDYVRKYIDKHGDLPDSPIDLLKINKSALPPAP